MVNLIAWHLAGHGYDILKRFKKWSVFFLKNQTCASANTPIVGICWCGPHVISCGRTQAIDNNTPHERIKLFDSCSSNKAGRPFLRILRDLASNLLPPPKHLSFTFALVSFEKREGGREGGRRKRALDIFDIVGFNPSPPSLRSMIRVFTFLCPRITPIESSFTLGSWMVTSLRSTFNRWYRIFLLGAKFKLFGFVTVVSSVVESFSLHSKVNICSFAKCAHSIFCML